MNFLFRALQLSFELYATRELLPVPPASTLEDIWARLATSYFPEHLLLQEYTLHWSTRRHRRTLASCNIERKRISVASAMQLPEARPHLEALLYHEMCHAILGIPIRTNGRRNIHGREFRALERAHPGIAELDRWILAGGWAASTRRYNRSQGQRRRWGAGKN